MGQRVIPRRRRRETMSEQELVEWFHSYVSTRRSLRNERREIDRLCNLCDDFVGSYKELTEISTSEDVHEPDDFVAVQRDFDELADLSSRVTDLVEATLLEEAMRRRRRLARRAIRDAEMTQDDVSVRRLENYMETIIKPVMRETVKLKSRITDEIMTSWKLRTISEEEDADDDR